MNCTIKVNVLHFLIVITFNWVLQFRQRFGLNNKADSSIGSSSDSPRCKTCAHGGEPSHDMLVHQCVCLFSLLINIIIESVIHNPFLNLDKALGIIIFVIVFVDRGLPIHLGDIPLFDVIEPDVTQGDPSVSVCFPDFDFALTSSTSHGGAASYHDLVVHEVIYTQED